MTNISEQDSQWVIVGRFGRPHGIKGFATVISFTEPRENILDYANWYGYISYEWQPIKRLATEITHKSILTQIEGYQDREAVARLTNVDIAIKRVHLPVLPKDEYYWHDLVGMSVVTVEKVDLGTVVEVMSTGSNDVLVVVGDKRRLIPYLPGQGVTDVDASQRIITVDWDIDF